MKTKKIVKSKVKNKAKVKKEPLSINKWKLMKVSVKRKNALIDLVGILLNNAANEETGSKYITDKQWGKIFPIIIRECLSPEEIAATFYEIGDCVAIVSERSKRSNGK